MKKHAPADLEDGGPEAGAFRLAAFPNPPIDECPVTFLGSHGDRVVFAMPDGEIRDERAGDIGRLIGVDLFNCAKGRSFLGHWRGADDKFQRELAVVWFIRQCRGAGYWETSRSQRGLGVWPGMDGQVVLHCGDRLFIYERDLSKPPVIVPVVTAMREKWGPLYRLRAPTTQPGAPASIADGAWVRSCLDMWRFEPVGDDGLTGADLVAGWIMASLLGAVAPFRPHMLLYAMAGSGKTSLIHFVHALISGLSGDVIDSFTAAGLRNDLAGMARPLMIDEAEATPNAQGPGPVEQALDLIRRMATGEGAVRKMGTKHGGSVTQTAVGAVFMAAVNPVRLGSADASRIAEAKLNPLNSPTPADGQFKLSTDADLRRAIEMAKALAPNMLGRALTLSARYQAEVVVMKAAFARQGHSPRAADLAAALAAGRRLLLADDELDDDQADEEARFWAGLFASREASEVISNPGEDCLAHLFSWSSGLHVGDRLVNLGEVIRKVTSFKSTRDDLGHYGEVLQEHGLKLTQVCDPESGRLAWWLYVANNHPELEKVFERTTWRDWRRILPYLDAMGPSYKTISSEHPIRFGMIKQRALGIPLSSWLGTASQASQKRPTQDDE